MEKLNFSVNINAPKEKVWETLWNDATYREWTKAFSENSHAVTDWQQGSKVLFLDGQGRGMVSRIEINKPYEFMSFKHLGEVKDGIEDTESEAVKSWAGATENYTLTEANGATTVAIEMDGADDFKDYMVNTWPKALELLKSISESN